MKASYRKEAVLNGIGASHPAVAKRAGGTGIYPEVINNAQFNMEAPTSALST